MPKKRLRGETIGENNPPPNNASHTNNPKNKTNNTIKSVVSSRSIACQVYAIGDVKYARLRRWSVPRSSFKCEDVHVPNERAEHKSGDITPASGDGFVGKPRSPVVDTARNPPVHQKILGGDDCKTKKVTLGKVCPVPRSERHRSAALFIRTMEGIKLSTRKTYASNLLGLMGQLAVPCPTLKMARKGMMNMGADSAPEKATPATISQVNTLIREYMETNPLLSLTFWLMWKTASRFSDVRALTRENFKVVCPQEIIVIFGKTKTNQEQKVKSSSLVQILDRMPMTWQCQLLNNLPPHHNKVPVEYNAFLRHVARLFPILTAHSFKHGAHDHLMSEAFAGRLSDIRAIPLLMKHSDPSSNYPEQSIQYGSTQSHIFYARMLGSGRATLVL